MTGAQTLAGAAGAGLVLVNEWQGDGRRALAGVVWDRDADPAAARAALVRIGGELLFVVVAVVLAGLGGHWPAFITAMLVALWVLWAVNRHGGGRAPKTPGGGS